MSRTLAEIDADLAKVKALRLSGVTSTQFADRATSYSQAALAQQEAELKRERAAVAGRHRQSAGYSSKGL